MSRKDYKQGAADAMNAYEAFARKQEEATRHVGDQIGRLSDDVAELGKSVGFISDYITDKEKQALYQANMPLDIAELDETDQYLLVAVLYELAQQEPPTEEQQNYIRAVQKYLKVRDVQRNIDLAVVENIPDTATIIAVMQAVMEYFYLGTHPGTYTEDEMDFLDSFMANRKTRKEIMARIKAIVNAVGKQGLAEKYGFVPEPEEEETQNQNNAEFFPFSPEIADRIAVKTGWRNGDRARKNRKITNTMFANPKYCETNNFIAVERDNSICGIEKRTGVEKAYIDKKKWTITGVKYQDLILLDNDDNNVCILNLATNECMELYVPGYYRSWGKYISNRFIIYHNENYEMQAFDIISRSAWIIKGTSGSQIRATDVVIHGDTLYYLEDQGLGKDDVLVEYDLSNRSGKVICGQSFSSTNSRIYVHGNCIYIITKEDEPGYTFRGNIKVYKETCGEVPFEISEVACYPCGYRPNYLITNSGSFLYNGSTGDSTILCAYIFETGEHIVVDENADSMNTVLAIGNYVYYEKGECVYRTDLRTKECCMI